MILGSFQATFWQFIQICPATALCALSLQRNAVGLPCRKGHWAGDRKQTTLWHISGKGQDAATVHGTQKPVECMRRPMLNNSSPGQAVYEPFMGSGTTLIAAETTGRVCYGIELNPAYVDVAVERWQQFTGANVVLVTTGETFADLKAKRLGT
jgi:hypothetical protein